MKYMGRTGTCQLQTDCTVGYQYLQAKEWRSRRSRESFIEAFACVCLFSYSYEYIQPWAGTTRTRMIPGFYPTQHHRSPTPSPRNPQPQPYAYGLSFGSESQNVQVSFRRPDDTVTFSASVM